MLMLAKDELCSHLLGSLPEHDLKIHELLAGLKITQDPIGVDRLRLSSKP